MANSLSLANLRFSPRAASLLVGYLVAYVALDWVSYIYPIGPLGITPWNPPPGLSLALLLRYGIHYGPWLMVAAAAAEILVRGVPAPLPLLALSSATLAVGYTLVAWLLRGPLRFDSDFRSLRDGSVFTSIVVVATAVLALAYVAIFDAAGLLPAGMFAKSVAQFWIGDLIGIVVTTPLLLVFTRGDPLWLRMRPWDALAQLFSIALTLWIVFASGIFPELNLFYLLFLPLIWVAMRHELPGTTVATALIQLGLIVALQIGGFTGAVVLQFQFLLLALAVTGLFLGAAISEQRQTASRLRDKQLELDRSLRMAAASELASALAHELNQPLSAIATYTRACQLMLAQQERSETDVSETMEKVVQETARASGVVRRLREFFRVGAIQLESLNLEALLHAAVAAERQRIERHGVRCHFDCAPGLPQVRADRVQIAIVLHNLIANAIDALKESSSDERNIRLVAAAEPGRFVRVSIADTGPGISEAMAEQLLHPFVSSKAQGMGLGLAISRSIVEAHGGRLSVEARHRGGFVSFTLPAT